MTGVVDRNQVAAIRAKARERQRANADHELIAALWRQIELACRELDPAADPD
jgi:hypothetical protein